MHEPTEPTEPQNPPFTAVEQREEPPIAPLPTDAGPASEILETIAALHMNGLTSPPPVILGDDGQPANQAPEPEPPPLDPHRWDRELLWQEDRDEHGNSTFTALSHTYANEAGEPIFPWIVKCVLRNNEAVFDTRESHKELQPDFETETIYPTEAKAKMACQLTENALRAQLAGDRPTPPAPEPEKPPVTADEHGFSPTTIVRCYWSKNGGRLKPFRVWRNPANGLEDEREILDQPDRDEAIVGFFRQKMVEECVTRLVTGGFGRIIWETPFATVVMQVELDFLSISAFTVTVREGAQVRDLPAEAPTVDRIMRVVAVQMAERKRQLAEKIGNSTEAQLIGEIMRSAQALGIPVDPPAPEVLTPSEPGIAPVELGDVHAAGGDITDLGFKKGVPRG